MVFDAPKKPDRIQACASLARPAKLPCPRTRQGAPQEWRCSVSKEKQKGNKLDDWNADRSEELAGIEYDLKHFRHPNESIRECVLRLIVEYARLNHKELEQGLLRMQTANYIDRSKAEKGDAQ